MEKVIVNLLLRSNPWKLICCLEASDVQGFMINSGPKLSSEQDGLFWTSVRIGQIPLIRANWALI